MDILYELCHCFTCCCIDSPASVSYKLTALPSMHFVAEHVTVKPMTPALSSTDKDLRSHRLCASLRSVVQPHCPPHAHPVPGPGYTCVHLAVHVDRRLVSTEPYLGRLQ